MSLRNYKILHLLIEVNNRLDDLMDETNLNKEEKKELIKIVERTELKNNNIIIAENLNDVMLLEKFKEAIAKYSLSEILEKLK